MGKTNTAPKKKSWCQASFDQGEMDAEMTSIGRAPRKGDRIEVRRSGVVRLGTVQFVSDLQILVKWDDGSSSGLRVDRDAFRILGERASAA
jgi:hypothetical protein